MKLTIDLDLQQLIVSLNSPSRLGSLSMQQNDRGETCEIWLTKRSGGEGSPMTVQPLPDPYTTIAMVGRAKDELGNHDPLFSVGTFEATGDGQTLHYTGQLNLNTSTIAAKFTGETATQIQALVDITFRNDEATIEETYVKQWPCIITRDIARGGEITTADPNVVYPDPALLLLNSTNSALFKRGVVNVDALSESADVAFASAFTAAPAMVQAWLVVPAGGAFVACWIDKSTVTSAGFTCQLGAALPAAGYQLQWLAFLH